jgi:transcription initiation factor IIE alpha subunit
MAENEDILNEIKETLDDIKAILLLVNQDAIATAKKNLLKESSVEKQVYDLCNGDNTTEDISNTIKKSKEYTRAVLSTLRQKGLVKTIQKDDKKIPEQVM